MGSRGVNKAILVGNLGETPEIRYTSGSEAVASFSIATSDRWKDKNSGQNQERTEWHKICAFGKLAELAARYLQKGTKIYCEGQLKTKKWTDQQGVAHYTTQIHMKEMQILAGGIIDNSYSQPSNEPLQKPFQQYAKASGSTGGGGVDDDIPFGRIDL